MEDWISAQPLTAAVAIGWDARIRTDPGASQDHPTSVPFKNVFKGVNQIRHAAYT
jgi:hypothetical protein